MPPYDTGLAALVDGWRLLQLSAVVPPAPGHEYDVSTLRHEAVFERLVAYRSAAPARRPGVDRRIWSPCVSNGDLVTHILDIEKESDQIDRSGRGP